MVERCKADDERPIKISTFSRQRHVSSIHLWHIFSWQEAAQKLVRKMCYGIQTKGYFNTLISCCIIRLLQKLFTLGFLAQRGNTLPSFTEHVRWERVVLANGLLYIWAMIKNHVSCDLQEIFKGRGPPILKAQKSNTGHKMHEMHWKQTKYSYKSSQILKLCNYVIWSRGHLSTLERRSSIENNNGGIFQSEETCN